MAPVLLVASSLLVSFQLAGFYGISIAALGVLGTLSTTLAIDAFGPITDNAGGIAEMSHMGEDVREITDALDAAGNTTGAATRLLGCVQPQSTHTSELCFVDTRAPRPLRAASATPARASSFESYSTSSFSALLSPPRPTRYSPSPFPACAAPAPPLRISASTAAPSAPPPLCDHLLPRQLPTTPKQRAHHAARLPASCPQRGLLAQSQDAPARFSAASRTDALLQSRRFERYGPVRRRVLARCRCTAGTRLSCRAWPGGLVA